MLALLLSALAVDATGQRSVAAAELPERPASSGAITFEGTGVQPLTPARLLDTRPTGTTIDGQFQATGTLGPDATTTITVTNRGGVPATGVAAVAVNITAVNPTTNTFITAYPTGTTRPNASTFNPRAGVTIANSAILKLGTNGQLTLYNQTGNVHLIIDVTGWYATGTGVQPLT
ncbi:MAG TPA: hypothetical protein DCR14_02650, partial [Acidimicrobiaceae bacterium]|nr:hypothetical protein [Acidimicrobiaceae bacterium]